MLNYKKTAFWIMIVAVLALVVAAGCFPINSTTADTQSSDDPKDDHEDFGSEFWRGENTAFEAECYASRGNSRLGTVIVSDHNVYISDVLYDKIIYTEDFTFSVSEQDFVFFWSQGDDEELFQIVETLQNQKRCYIFESERSAGKIVFYDIDGTYYFLEFFDDQLYNIMKGNLEKRNSLYFSPKIYVPGKWDDHLRQFSTLSLQWQDETLYIKGTEYETITYTEDFVPVYSETILARAQIHEDVLKTLEKIKHYKGCYILESNYSDSLDKIAVYEIDNMYYFLNFSEHYEDGAVIMIWRATFTGKYETIPNYLYSEKISGEGGSKTVWINPGEVVIEEWELSHREGCFNVQMTAGNTGYMIYYELYDAQNRLVASGEDTAIQFYLQMKPGKYSLHVHSDAKNPLFDICLDYDRHIHTDEYDQAVSDGAEHHFRCVCGEAVSGNHIIDLDSFADGAGTATCVICGDAASVACNVPIEELQHTELGSCILPNGVVVLDDREDQEYFHQNLCFSPASPEDAWDGGHGMFDGTIAFMAGQQIVRDNKVIVNGIHNPRFDYVNEYPVVVKDGRLYLNGYRYEKITYTEDFGVIYHGYLIENASHEAGKQEMLDQIKNHKGFYILESENSGMNQKIVLCEIDDIYYFLHMDPDSNPSLVQYIRVGALSETEELRFEVPIYLKPSDSEEYDLFRIIQKSGGLHLFYNPGALNALYAYNCYTYTENFNLVYSDALLAAADSEILAELEVIKNQAFCYILEEDVGYGNCKIAVYKVGGSFYFLKLNESNEAVCIWRLPFGM